MKEELKKCYIEVNCEYGVGCSHLVLSEEKVLQLFYTKMEDEKQKLKKNIGQLRQWLNEDRIKDADKFVTNEQIELWLVEDKAK